MSALTPVGISQSISSSTSSTAVTLPISQKTDTIRVVAEGVGVHVAIGVTPTATNSNFYVPSTGPEEIAIGRPASQRVVGITTGVTTIIDFPEGTGSPFSVGDAVTLTSGTQIAQPYYNFTHKVVTAINTGNIQSGGYYNTRITVNNDSSGIVTAFNSDNYTELRKSISVAVKAQTGTGVAYVQQVQQS
tara:strand:+ start:6058 stop:6624 length:567 start_codon:yes stop_codon:yes gene_type:complete